MLNIFYNSSFAHLDLKALSHFPLPFNLAPPFFWTPSDPATLKNAFQRLHDSSYYTYRCLLTQPSKSFLGTLFMYDCLAVPRSAFQIKCNRSNQTAILSAASGFLEWAVFVQVENRPSAKSVVYAKWNHSLSCNGEGGPKDCMLDLSPFSEPPCAPSFAIWYGEGHLPFPSLLHLPHGPHEQHSCCTQFSVTQRIF